MKRSNFMSYLLLLAANYQFIVERIKWRICVWDEKKGMDRNFYGKRFFSLYRGLKALLYKQQFVPHSWKLYQKTHLLDVLNLKCVSVASCVAHRVRVLIYSDLHIHESQRFYPSNGYYVCVDPNNLPKSSTYLYSIIFFSRFLQLATFMKRF